jgi:hypothetical protein
MDIVAADIKAVTLLRFIHSTLAFAAQARLALSCCVTAKKMLPRA